MVVSHVYSYILYLKKLVISMFLDAFRIQRIWLFIMFLDTFHNQKCLETVKRQNPLKYSKNLVTSPVSGHLPYSKVFLDTYRIQKCPERVKRQNPLKYSKNLVKSPVSGHFPYSKVSRKSKTTKSLEVFKEFGQFSCF